MPLRLNDVELGRYEKDGYLSPLRTMSAETAASYRDRLEAYEAQSGGPLRSEVKHKVHLLFTWAAEIVRMPRLLDAVEDIIGPDILCWGTSFFVKEAHDPGYVSWHQDLTYWGLDPADVITAWVALSPSTDEAGAMRVIPGSHKQDVLDHVDTFEKHNLLTRGQEVAVNVDETKAVTLALEPGQMSLHHVKLIHGSRPNRTAERRIGLAIRYMPPSVRQVVGPRDSATLVRGVDTFGHFDHEPEPEYDMAPAACALHREIMQRHAAILYRDTEVTSFR